MLRKALVFLLSLTSVLALALSAVGTTTVYADDGTTAPPPNTDTSGASNPTGSPEGSTDSQPAVDASSPGSDAVSNGDSQPAAASTDGSNPALANNSDPAAAPADATTADSSVPISTEPAGDSQPAAPVVDPSTPASDPAVTAAIPDNTTMAVLNPDGATVPLATQQAADAIVASDPIWCPQGQSPSPGANNCTSAFSSFNALLTYLKANESSTTTYQQAGTIYVQMANYNGDESSIDFNSYHFTSLNNYDLTVQGGWNTSNNTLNPSTGTTFNNVPLTIGANANPWAGSLSFKDLLFNNVNNGVALTAYSAASISLSNVKITNSGTGANLKAGRDVTIDNSKFDNNKKAGAVIGAGGSVVILDSSFNKNGVNNQKNADGTGLDLASGGDVALINVYANQNHLSGANIQTKGFVSVGNSFFSGNTGYTYSRYCGCSTTTGGYGLQIVTTNGIAIYQVAASDNYLFGASLTGSDIAVSSSTFDNNGALDGKNANGYGLYANSGGGVSLNAVEANNNQLYGANIQAASNIEISHSFFSGNQAYKYSCSGKTAYDGYGLQVVTTGAVSLDGVTASDNYLYGASLTGSDAAVSDSTFDSNGPGSSKNATGTGYGLSINSSGGASLHNVEASYNHLYGANIRAAGSVAIDSGFFSGNTAYTYSSCKGKTAFDGYGLQVVTTGAVSLSGVTASDNYLYGASLTGSDVSVSNSVFDNNGSGSGKDSVGYGLQITSSASSSLSSVEANNNQRFGANVQAVGIVSISNSFFSGNKAYTYSSCKGTTTTGYGLQVVTTDSIFLSSVTASDNGAEGAILKNQSDVIVSDSTFDTNGATGLAITTSGKVTLTNVVATNNGVDGVDVTGNCANSVYVIAGTYSGNSKYGLKIVNATLNLSGSPIFANNGSANIFQSSNCSGGGGNGGGGHDGHGGNDHHDGNHYDWDHKTTCGRECR